MTTNEYYYDGISPDDKKIYENMTSEEIEKEISEERKKSEQLKTW